jgi:hypothetical protein
MYCREREMCNINYIILFPPGTCNVHIQYMSLWCVQHTGLVYWQTTILGLAMYIWSSDVYSTRGWYIDKCLSLCPWFLSWEATRTVLTRLFLMSRLCCWCFLFAWSPVPLTGSLKYILLLFFPYNFPCSPLFHLLKNVIVSYSWNSAVSKSEWHEPVQYR